MIGWVQTGKSNRINGRILSLESFSGPVTISQNNFINNRLKFTNCDIGISTSLDSYNDNQALLASKEYIQMRPLIAMVDIKGEVVINDNTFQNNTVT